ncbi:unnamed protein product [Allacma fusca]|uniref:U2A'/phosphoprotein 32 family A C-terminal domain-containing protein n=1 Tax=Allacma fusca TaxID=39272 RepID=A0A8J2JNM1_9HEXA|nr:unnamed protein product [Allacma fusca]
MGGRGENTSEASPSSNQNLSVVINMEKRIELEKRRRPSSQIEELNLDNCRSTTIEGLTDEFLNLRSLSLISVGLTSLKGFPKLPKLRKLELSDNRISGGLQILKECEKLTVLNLSNNKIKDFETLEPLKELKSLKSLDLFRNEVTEGENYREKVFALLPELTYLDSIDRNGKDAEESDLDDEEIKEMNGKGEEEDEDEESEEDENEDGNEEGKQTGGVGKEDLDDEDVEEEEEIDEEEDEDDDGDDPSAIGLKDIYRDYEKESDDEDFDEEAISDDEDDDEDIDEDDPEAASNWKAADPNEGRRGTKRQHEDDEEESD